MEYTRPSWKDLKEGEKLIYVGVNTMKKKPTVADLRTAVLVKKAEGHKNKYDQELMEILVAVNGGENIICTVLANEEYFWGTEYGLYTSIEGVHAYEF